MYDTIDVIHFVYTIEHCQETNKLCNARMYALWFLLVLSPFFSPVLRYVINYLSFFFLLFYFFFLSFIFSSSVVPTTSILSINNTFLRLLFTSASSNLNASVRQFDIFDCRASSVVRAVRDYKPSLGSRLQKEPKERLHSLFLGKKSRGQLQIPIFRSWELGASSKTALLA